MGRRHRHDDRRFADRDVTDPVDHRHPPDVGPLRASRLDDVAQSGKHLLFVGFVFEAVDTRSFRGEVPGRSAERDRCATRREHDPGRGFSHGEGTVNEVGPILTVVGYTHLIMLVLARPTLVRPTPREISGRKRLYSLTP